MLLNLIRVFFILIILITKSAIAQRFYQQSPITIRENLIYITVHINGHGPYTFLFDSGTSDVGRIDYRVAKALQLNIVGYQENSDGYHVKRVILVAIDKLNLGQITHSGLKLIVSDYNTKPGPISIDGVIGRDFFYDYLVTIDGPAKQLIVSHGQLDARAEGVLTYQKPFLIPGKVGQTDLFFNLDTGSNLSVHLPTYLMTRIHFINTSAKRVITSAKTTIELQEAILTDELLLGSVKVKDQKIYYSDKANQINVGEGFLKEHSVTIDQRRKLIRID